MYFIINIMVSSVLDRSLTLFSIVRLMQSVKITMVINFLYYEPIPA